jgi:hypothetical protein
MSHKYNESVTLEAIICPECGTVSGIPQSFIKTRMDDHRGFYCPNGHSQYFPGQWDSELEREKREAATLRERAIGAERAKQRAEASLTRYKKRAAAGVCPCCNRTVEQLAKHMKSKHQQFMQLQGIAKPKQLAEKVRG